MATFSAIYSSLNSLVSTGDSVRQPPPSSAPASGDQSTQSFIIIVRLRNRMQYAWTSHSAIDINAHTRIGVCRTYNIAFE